MHLKRLFCMAVCAVLLGGGNVMTAQTPDMGMPGQSEGQFTHEYVSPEETARKTTDHMNAVLGLSEKQYKKLYKQNLKWAREDAENNSPKPPMGDRRGGRPDFGNGGGPGGPGGFGQGPGGGRPPQGMGGRPPQGMDNAQRDMSPEELQKKMEKQRQKRDKKLRKLLTEEQYARWTEELQKTKPGAPENRPPSPR